MSDSNIFSDFLKSAKGSNFHYLNGNNQYIRVDWKNYLSMIDDFSNSYSSSGGGVCAILIGKSFLWDLVNYSCKLKKLSVLGLNHHDNDKRINGLLEAQNVNTVITDEKNLSRVQSFFSGRIIAVTLESNGVKIISDNSNCTLSVNRTLNSRIEVYDILHSSGTTGSPKFFSYSEEQTINAVSIMSDFYKDDLLGVEDTICWMPLANPFQRMLNLVSIKNGHDIYYVDDPKKLPQYLKTIHPGYIASTPRLYEKVYSEFYSTVIKLPLLGGYIKASIDSFISGKELPTIRKFFIRVITQKAFKSFFGNKLKFMVSGSAPLPNWLERFLHAFYRPIYQAYGMSENIVPVAMSNSKNYKNGSVGVIASSNKVKITNREILVNGPGLNREFKSTHKTGDFLSTGDYGHFDQDNFLYLAGRKGDYFKTSTGRRIYPGGIEDKIKKLVGVNHVCIMGEGLKHPVAVMDVEDSFRKNYPSTCEIQEALSLAIEGANAYEQPQLYLFVQNTFVPGSEYLTSNLKLKRREIIKEYQPVAKDIIDSIPKSSTGVTIRNI